MLRGIHPVLQALLASLLTWGVTALGAAAVFVLPPRSKKLLDVSLGFAAGVMMAASFWSLLAPAIEIAQHPDSFGPWAFVPVAIGFGFGAAFVHFADQLMPTCILSDSPIIDMFRNGPCAGVGLDDDRSTGGEIEPKPDADMSRDAAVIALANGAAGQLRPPSTGAHQRREQMRIEEQESMLAGYYRHPSSTSTSTSSPPTNSVRQRRVPASGHHNKIPNGRTSVDDRPALPPSTTIHRDITAVSWKRILLLIVAVTVHNIPEGLAVGVGFGSIGSTEAATFESASNLAIGIALQNFPEGLAVSLPLAAFGHSRLRSFLYGQLSGMVEPIFAVLGAAAVLLMRPALPYALSFAAGAMIYVVVDDIVPEAQRNDNGKLASVGTIVGFLVMMCLDVGLG